jgi:hypothetical protein
MITATKWDGQQISKSGFYTGIGMPDYHGDLCVGPSVSSSGLRTIWDRSPAHYYAQSYLNPNAKRQDKPEFAFGRAAHKLLIEGKDGFEDEYAVRPEEWPDWRSKSAQTWRDEQIAAGKTVITPEEVLAIGEMATSLGSHPLVKQGILDGMIERSIVWQDAETGVWLKARPDAIPGDCTDLVDLKTTGSVADDDIQRSITSFGYNVQAAVACEGVKQVFNFQVETFTLVFVEKTAPYAVRIVTIPAEDIDRGHMQMAWATRTFARCVKTNEWPGPGAVDAEFMGLSQWARNKIDERLQRVSLNAEQYDWSV